MMEILSYRDEVKCKTIIKIEVDDDINDMVEAKRLIAEDTREQLRKYWKIEQELGIPLEVLFKALKEGIIMDDEEYRTFLMYDEVTNSYCFKCGGWGKYFLKDYGKTWALTREELENAKD